MKRNSFDLRGVATVGCRVVLGAAAAALLLSTGACGTTTGGAAIERGVILLIGPHDPPQTKASVLIDGESMGTAPMGATQGFYCRVVAGKRHPHKLKVTAPGYEPYEVDLTVPAGTGSFWVNVELKAASPFTVTRPEDK